MVILATGNASLFRTARKGVIGMEKSPAEARMEVDGL
jgi:hypothetical protein